MKVAARPIRLYHGTADDWTPVEQCRILVADLKKAGADITLTEFAGATHAYDNAERKERTAIPEAVTLRKCSLREGDKGQIVNAKTGQPFMASDPCVEHGVSVQYDGAATAATREAVKAVLTSVFAGKQVSDAPPRP